MGISDQVKDSQEIIRNCLVYRKTFWCEEKVIIKIGLWSSSITVKIRSRIISVIVQERKEIKEAGNRIGGVTKVKVIEYFWGKDIHTSLWEEKLWEWGAQNLESNMVDVSHKWCTPQVCWGADFGSLKDRTESPKEDPGVLPSFIVKHK